MMKNKHILFIHIPKTAGTSFRMAAEEYYEKSQIFYDYSPHAKETSEGVKKSIYEEQDPYSLYEGYIFKEEKSFFCGHFSVNKYEALYDTCNVVSFLRNPVEQVLSHYNHHKRHHKYDKDFISFIKEPRFRNLQFKSLQAKMIGMYGFLGLTEEYTRSITLFNHLYDSSLKVQHLNKKSTSDLLFSDIDKKTLKLIERVNAKDIEFYTEVKKQFEVRKFLHDKGLDFTYGYIQKSDINKISGIAFYKDGCEPIKIDIYAGEVYLDTVEAKNLRIGQRNVPRKGYIGFDYICNEEQESSIKLSAFNSMTKQEIIEEG